MDGTTASGAADAAEAWDPFLSPPPPADPEGGGTEPPSAGSPEGRDETPPGAFSPDPFDTPATVSNTTPTFPEASGITITSVSPQKPRSGRTPSALRNAPNAPAPLQELLARAEASGDENLHSPESTRAGTSAAGAVAGGADEQIARETRAGMQQAMERARAGWEDQKAEEIAKATEDLRRRLEEATAAADQWRERLHDVREAHAKETRRQSEKIAGLDREEKMARDEARSLRDSHAEELARARSEAADALREVEAQRQRRAVDRWALLGRLLEERGAARAKLDSATATLVLALSKSKRMHDDARSESRKHALRLVRRTIDRLVFGQPLRRAFLCWASSVRAAAELEAGAQRARRDAEERLGQEVLASQRGYVRAQIKYALGLVARDVLRRLRRAMGTWKRAVASGERGRRVSGEEGTPPSRTSGASVIAGAGGTPTAGGAGVDEARVVRHGAPDAMRTDAVDALDDVWDSADARAVAAAQGSYMFAAAVRGFQQRVHHGRIARAFYVWHARALVAPGRREDAEVAMLRQEIGRLRDQLCAARAAPGRGPRGSPRGAQEPPNSARAAASAKSAPRTRRRPGSARR